MQKWLGDLPKCALDRGDQTGFPQQAANDVATVVPAVGGAMDLAIGAKQVFVMMNLFAKDGTAKLVPLCTYPLTGLRCVSRVYTDHGVFHIDPTGDGHVHVTETFGLGVAALAERMQLDVCS